MSATPLCFECVAVFHGEHPHEFRPVAFPVGQHGGSAHAPGRPVMGFDQVLEFLLRLRARFDAFQIDPVGIAGEVEVPLFVVDVGQSPRHAGGEVHADV